MACSQTNFETVWVLIRHAIETSIHAWEMALSSLPTENLSQGDKRLQSQYEAGLKSSKDAMEKHRSTNPFLEIPGSAITEKRLPWQRATAMREELSQARNGTSSVCPLAKSFRITAVLRVNISYLGLGHIRSVHGDTLCHCMLISAYSIGSKGLQNWSGYNETRQGS
jgi:hypothetical protein